MVTSNQDLCAFSNDEGVEPYCGGASCLVDVMAAVSVLNGRWAPAVLEAIYFSDEPCRFRELQRKIRGITQKELARHLSHFVGNGVLSKHQEPNAVRYSLTDDGLLLLKRLQALGEWNRSRSLGTARVASFNGGPEAPATWLDPIL